MKSVYLIVLALVASLSAYAQGSDTDRAILVDSFSAMTSACKDLKAKGINCTRPRAPTALENMRKLAGGQFWARNSHFLKPQSQSTHSAHEGKRNYAVLVWYQSGETEAGTPRIRAFLKTFAVDYHGQATAVDGVEADTWHTISQTLRVADIDSEEERQYEADLLDQKNHRETLAREAEARRAQIAVDNANSREQARRQQEEQERKADAEKQRTKPLCVDVLVNGLIASSPNDVEALHAPHLSASQLEDVLARHPYSCRINQFGVAYGCQGGAFISGRQAKIMNWTPSHYIIAIPLDFQRGRHDAPAFVRRSEVQCLSSSAQNK